MNPTIRLRVLPALIPVDGRQIELQTTDTYLQYRYVGDVSWVNLIALSELAGPSGPAVEMRSNGTYLQYRAVGALTWTNVIPLTDITGATGPTGPVGPAGAGDVVGPASSVANRIAVFSGTTGKLIADGGKTVDDITDGSRANGRLTLESGVAVSSTDQLAKTTLYWTPFRGNKIGLYVSGAWVLRSFVETSLSLSGFTSGKPYDIFAYDNAGTLALEALVWTNDTTRATALALQDGILVKSGATTRRYLGTIYTSATGQTQMKFGGSAGGGVAGYFGVYNYYNRCDMLSVTVDTTTTWSYASATIRAMDASNSNRCSFIIGVSEDTIQVQNSILAQGTAVMRAGIGLNSTSAYTGACYEVFESDDIQTMLKPTLVTMPPIGFNYVQALEASPQAVTINFFGAALYSRMETKVKM